jgi:hypothetical protein
MKEKVDQKGRYQKEPDRQRIADVHGPIKEAWFFFEIDPAVRTLLIDLSEFTQVVGTEFKKFPFSALRASTLQES